VAIDIEEREERRRMRKELLEIFSPHRETADHKADRFFQPTGNRLYLVTEPRSVPVSRNWIQSQQRYHLLMDLAADALRMAELVWKKGGWSPLTEKDEADLERLSRVFKMGTEPDD
jgi:hypothetical protein